MPNDFTLLGLNRPEYIPSRELFMSELAWSFSERNPPSSDGPQSSHWGLAYAATSTAARQESLNAGIGLTRPYEGDERFNAMMAMLHQELRINDNRELKLVATVLLDELAAPASRGAKRSAATPITIATALLQDRRGVTGKKNAANIARILEQLYSLGGGEGSVAAWWQSALVNGGSSGLPRWAPKTFATLTTTSSASLAEQLRSGSIDHQRLGHRRPAWLGSLSPSPYRWFARSWNRLCRDGWIEAMPRRRWTDWACCVARTAIATGFLFEMHVARRLVAALVVTDDASKVAADVLVKGRALLPWNDRLSLSASDVGPVINRLAGAGSASLELLEQLTKPDDGQFEGIAITPIREFDDSPNGLSEWLRNVRLQIAGKPGVSEAVTEALSSGVVGGARNTRETIRYSLLDRGADDGGDLYALLRGAGKFTRVDPGQEWLVTVASLCADGPGGLARLGDLRGALSELGIQASTPTIITLLERYGMARSSHDADDALEIQAGF